MKVRPNCHELACFGRNNRPIRGQKAPHWIFQTARTPAGSHTARSVEATDRLQSIKCVHGDEMLYLYIPTPPPHHIPESDQASSPWIISRRCLHIDPLTLRRSHGSTRPGATAPARPRRCTDRGSAPRAAHRHANRGKRAWPALLPSSADPPLLRSPAVLPSTVPGHPRQKKRPRLESSRGLLLKRI